MIKNGKYNGENSLEKTYSHKNTHSHTNMKTTTQKHTYIRLPTTSL